MPSRSRWCVAEISKDGTIKPISSVFEYVEDAEKRRNELLEEAAHKGKSLQVVKASYPVDPRKPPRPRRK